MLDKRADVQLAVNNAVDTTLGVLERNYSQCRIMTNGISRTVTTGNLIIAVFEHHTSRALDPEYHHHCLIANTTQAPNGRYYSLKNDAFCKHHRKLLGTIYQNELAWNLRNLGFSIKPHGNGTFDVIGYTRSQILHFSQRRVQILETAQGPSWKQRHVGNLRTRTGKQIIPEEDLNQEWEQRAALIELPRLVPQPHRLAQVSDLNLELPNQEEVTQEQLIQDTINQHFGEFSYFTIEAHVNQILQQSGENINAYGSPRADSSRYSRTTQPAVRPVRAESNSLSAELRTIADRLSQAINRKAGVRRVQRATRAIRTITENLRNRIGTTYRSGQYRNAAYQLHGQLNRTTVHLQSWKLARVISKRKVHRAVIAHVELGKLKTLNQMLQLQSGQVAKGLSQLEQSLYRTSLKLYAVRISKAVIKVSHQRQIREVKLPEQLNQKLYQRIIQKRPYRKMQLAIAKCSKQLSHQQGLEAAKSIRTMFLEVGVGQQVRGGHTLNAQSHIYKLQGQQITVEANDGRGQILSIRGETVESNHLTTKDLKVFQKLKQKVEKSLSRKRGEQQPPSPKSTRQINPIKL